MGTGPYAQPRRSERKPQKLDVNLLAKAAGVEFQQPACTVDVSQHGLRIQTEGPINEARPLNPGQMVYVYAPGKVQLGYCRIVWVRTDNPASCSQAGLAFLN
jgi:hypothetical protein